MSHTYELRCAAKKLKLWVGQGWGGMTNFYSGMPKVMEKLGRFLEATRGEDLKLVDTEEDFDSDFVEFEDSDPDGLDPVTAWELEALEGNTPVVQPEVSPPSERDCDAVASRREQFSEDTHLSDPCSACGGFRMTFGWWACYGYCEVCTNSAMDGGGL